MAPPSDLAERIAALEAREDERDRTVTDLAETLDRLAKDELERLGKVYDAINGLRQDLWMAKGGGRVALALGGLLIIAIGGLWSVFTYLHPAR